MVYAVAAARYSLSIFRRGRAKSPASKKVSTQEIEEEREGERKKLPSLIVDYFTLGGDNNLANRYLGISLLDGFLDNL